MSSSKAPAQVGKAVSFLDMQTPYIKPVKKSQVALVHPKSSPLSLSPNYITLELIKDATSPSKS